MLNNIGLLKKNFFKKNVFRNIQIAGKHTTRIKSKWNVLESAVIDAYQLVKKSLSSKKRLPEE